jgi:ATP-binding cassette subfamily F protein 3
MTLVTLDHIVRRYGDHVVLEDAGLRVDERDRIGIVGDNGAGKTTLVRILAGVEEPDGGSRQTSRGLRIALADQVPEFADGATVRDFVRAGDGTFPALERRIRALEEKLAQRPEDEGTLAEYGHLQAAFEAGGGFARDALCEKVLDGLGFPAERADARPKTLSGGERARVALAALITSPADVLILDEPTNHLDLEGIAFLEGFVQRYPSAICIVSHDRRFLDAVATTIVEVDFGTTARFKGNYSQYRRQRDERLLAEMRAFKNQQAFLEKEMEFIRRNQAGRMAVQARGRLKKLQRLQVLTAPRAGRGKRSMKLDLGGGGRGLEGQTMLEAAGLTLRIGGRTLLENAELRLMHGETVGLLGRNGSGKTTLMRTLCGQRRPDGGTIEMAPGTRTGYFSQEVTDLPQHVTVLEALRQITPTADEQELRDHLGSFLFSGDRVETSVSELSGGEKQRLALARLTRTDFDLLCLDEPTNHLDITGVEALELALRAFPGAILVISHDRAFLAAVVDRVFFLEDRALHRFDAGLDAAIARIDELRLQRRQAERAQAEAAKQRATPDAPAEKQAAPGKIRNPMMFARLEERIIAMEEELDSVRAQMADPDVYSDAGRMQELDARSKEIEHDLAEAYEAWENWN